MKYLIIAVFILTLFGCKTESERIELNSIKKMQITDAYFKAAFAKDYASLDVLLDDDVLFFGPQTKDTLSKVELIDSWRRAHARNDIMQYNNPKIYTGMYAIGDTNASECVFHYYDAHFHNSDLNIWLDFPVHVKFKFKNDKIYRMQIIINQAEIQKQLGYTITAPITE